MKILLIGYMGCGKSTIGKELAKVLNMPFYDTDELIVRKYNKSIKDIFLEEGEARFREMERQLLLEIQKTFPDGIFSTGGGMPCFGDNMQLMKETGKTIYLFCGVDLLVKRLKASTNRPIIKDKSPRELRKFIKAHLAERSIYYNKADIRVMAYDLPDLIIKRIISRIKIL